MRVIVRADADQRIGGGHVMRCAVLGLALRGQGADVAFAIRDPAPETRALLETWNFPVLALPAQALPEQPVEQLWPEPLMLRDAEDTARLAAEADAIVVDHYGLGAAWHRAMRGERRLVLALDDMADRAVDADLLLYPGLSASAQAYAGLVPVRCGLLLGPRYALLRPQFAADKGAAAQGKAALRRLLVCCGSGDHGNITARLIEGVLQAGLPGLVHVDVVLGGLNPHADALQRRFGAEPRLHFHHAVEDMAALMRAADLFLGAGGGMTWERCAAGLPGIVVALAPNQRPLSEAMAARGIDAYLGDGAALTPAKVAEALRQATPASAEAVAAMHALCDGQGAARVARRLCLGRLGLRAAVAEDGEALLNWRNAPFVRRFSGDGAEIPRADHEKWLAATLANPARHLLIGECRGADAAPQPVGVLRYDRIEDGAEISVYLVPGLDGLALGADLIRLGDYWLHKTMPAARRVRARIHPENQASIQAFRRAGYVAIADHYERRLGPP